LSDFTERKASEALMVKSVEGYLVARSCDFAQQARMPAGSAEQDKERGAEPPFIKHLQNAVCPAWLWSVVIGQDNFPDRRVDSHDRADKT
jgi:hypothetical protein